MGLGQSRAQKGLPLTIYSEYIKKKIYILTFLYKVEATGPIFRNRLLQEILNGQGRL